MRRVEQHVIEKSHPQFRAIDEMARSSKNLWNLANYHVRQSFIFQRRKNAARVLILTCLWRLIQASMCWLPLPRISLTSFPAWSLASR